MEPKIMGNRHGVMGLVLVLVITISLTLSAGCFFESKMPGDLRVYRTDASGTVLWNATIVTCQIFCVWIG